MKEYLTATLLTISLFFCCLTLDSIKRELTEISKNTKPVEFEIIKPPVKIIGK